MPEPNPAVVRVLIVDDDRDAAESLRTLLGLHGYPAAVALSGADGIRLAHQVCPHVVFCDIGLPEVDGFTVARSIRSDPATADTRLVAVTGYADDAVRQLAAEVGFDAHLVKPADPAAVLAFLDERRSPFPRRPAVG